jgi:hypothetical protein
MIRDCICPYENTRKYEIRKDVLSGIFHTNKFENLYFYFQLLVIFIVIVNRKKKDKKDKNV